MGKGEIARNEQFLLFPQCFLPVCRPFFHFHQTLNCRLQTLWVRMSLKCVVWERVNIRALVEGEVKTRSKISIGMTRVQRIHSSARIYKYKMSKDEWFFQHGRPAGRVITILTSYFYIPVMVFSLFLCIGHTKCWAGIQILMICNLDLR